MTKYLDYTGLGQFKEKLDATYAEKATTLAGYGITDANISGSTITLGENSINISGSSAMIGADGTNAGASGLVPAPTATDNNKYLRGDGTWATPEGGSGSIVTPTYDSTTHAIVFPTGSGATYNSTTHSIVF